MTRLLLVLTTLATGALIIWAPAAALSPGPLLKGHQPLTDSCLSCHRLGQSAQCASCHVVEKLRTAALHSNLKATACGTCHREHRGEAKATFTHDSLGGQTCAGCHLQKKPADAVHVKAERCELCHQPSAWKPARFEHTKVTAACDGCHLAKRPANEVHASVTACETCHTTTAWKPAAFDHQRAGDKPCAGCHVTARPRDDLHAAADDCRACHQTNAWKPATWDHSKYFTLDRDHTASCATCHPQGFKKYTCLGCHEHSEASLAHEHREEGIAELSDCVRCHRSANKHEGREREGERHKRHDDDDD